jgi:hypothetical protein
MVAPLTTNPLSAEDRSTEALSGYAPYTCSAPAQPITVNHHSCAVTGRRSAGLRGAWHRAGEL